MTWVWGSLLIISASLVAWTYLGYPVFIALLANLRPRPHERAPLEGQVSFVVPAYNEETYIVAKLENLLALDYPAALREIIVVADGSTDRTVALAQTFAAAHPAARIQVIFEPERRGKIAALNRAVTFVSGDILVFSDANTLMEPQSLRELLANFSDPRVACVGGEKRVRRAAEMQAEGESAYWRYESFVKRADSLVSTAIGAVGEFFAIRHELYRPMAETLLIDDFNLSMRLVMEGWRVVYEPRAVTWEEASPSLAAEWRRRSRTAAGCFQAIGELRELLSPRYGLVAFQYVSHKLLRWLAPFFMILAFLSNAVLATHPWFRYLFWGQTLFYGLAFLGWGLDVLGVRWKPIRMVFYFCFSNATALGGFWRYVTRKQSVLWEKVR